MAHFLSDVTHLRLELRDEEVEVNCISIVHTHDFTGQIRCLEVMPMLESDVETWTGDTDGTLTVRKGLDGRPVRSVRPVEPNVFIYCIQFVHPNVWMGRSDGFLQVFCADTYTKTFEFKGHCGAVNCLQQTDDFVLSGGSDWQIVVWDRSSAQRVHQLTGHINGVRCLAKDGFLIYSGGDEGTIHCWDLESMAEKTPLWPIAAHKQPVRCVVPHEVYLFSCSNDGSIKVWNSQTAQIAGVVCQRSAAINSLIVVPSTSKLWGSSSDGVVCVWDIPTLSLEASLADHRATNVPIVRAVASANSLKLWSLCGDGQIRVWYSDTDPSLNEFAALLEMEEELQTHVDKCRKRIVHNYNQLERCKEDLLELERRDSRKKQLFSMLLGESATRRKLLRSILVFHGAQVKSCNRSVQHQVCEIAYIQAYRRCTHSYFAVWRKFAALCARKKVQHNIKHYVTAVAQQNLTTKLLWQVAAFSKVEFNRRQMSTVAHDATRRTALSATSRVFQLWAQLAQTARLYLKQQSLIQCLDGTEAFLNSRISWKSLLEGQAAVGSLHAKSQCSLLLSRVTSCSILSRYFSSWVRSRNKSMEEKHLRRAADMLGASSRSTILGWYFRQWMSNRLRTVVSHSRSGAANEEVTIYKLQCITEASSKCTEASLEDDLHRKQLLLASILEENRGLDAAIDRQMAEKRVLQRELLRDYSIDRTQPVAEQLQKSVFFLKARGVNAFHDSVHLANAREELRKTGPEGVLADGILSIRKVFAGYAKPEKIKLKGEADWYIGEVFSKIKRKGVERASAGLCRIVLAFDAVDAKELRSWASDDGSSWGNKHQFAAEISANLGPLLELALRSYRYRRNEDPLTGMPKSKIAKKAIRKSFPGKKPSKIKRRVRRVVRRKKSPPELHASSLTNDGGTLRVADSVEQMHDAVSDGCDASSKPTNEPVPLALEEY